MRVIHSSRLILFIICIIFVIVYFLFAQDLNKNLDVVEEESAKLVTYKKEIIGFSLLKQIELDGREYNCEQFVYENNYNIKQSVKNTWPSRVYSVSQKLFIYSIYRDARLKPFYFLRILGMVQGTISTDPIYCQIQSSNGQQYVVKAKILEIWSKIWNQNDPTIYYKPVLISCLLVEDQKPIQLTLNKNPCTITNQKFYIKNKKSPLIFQNFTICIKPLEFKADISEYLLQWITINQILGCGKFEFYYKHINETTRKNLKKISNVNLHQFHEINENSWNNNTTKNRHALWQKRRYDIIALNDCFYRNIHSSHFIIPVDIDEIIVPRRDDEWYKLFTNISALNLSSYTVRNTYYFQRYSENLLPAVVTSTAGVDRKDIITPIFLKNLIRSDHSPEGESGKSFISTQNALTIFNHYSLENLKPGIGKIMFLSPELVQMNHYKNECDTKILPECAKYLSSHVRIYDDVIIKYEKRFYQQYKKLKQMVLNN